MNQSSQNFDGSRLISAREMQFRRMEKLAREWERTKVKPAGVSTLSTTEKVAVAIVTGNENLLSNPVYSFLNLDNSFQTWIMKHIGLDVLCGLKVGLLPEEEARYLYSPFADHYD